MVGSVWGVGIINTVHFVSAGIIFGALAWLIPVSLYYVGCYFTTKRDKFIENGNVHIPKDVNSLFFNILKVSFPFTLSFWDEFR